MFPIFIIHQNYLIKSTFMLSVDRDLVETTKFEFFSSNSNWISKIKCSKLSYPLRRREVTYYSITITCRMLFIFRLKISLFYKISLFLFFSAYELKSKVDFNSGTKISRLWNSWNWFADGKSLHTRFRRRPLGYGRFE